MEEPSRASQEADLGIVGHSAPIVELRARIRLAAAVDHPVLVLGETGTGKELIAKAIHELSARRGEPFLCLNSAAFVDDLIDAELFGHEHGSFTGAHQKRDGLLKQVGRGTLFLDEIGELRAPLQAKLLRLLEDGRFRPVGSNHDLRFDGRIVAATHRDPYAPLSDGQWREDFFHRIAVLVVAAPSLADRRDDIRELAEHFGRRASRQLLFTECAHRELEAHDWPGNVRELRNTLSSIETFERDDPVDANAVRRNLAPRLTAPSVPHLDDVFAWLAAQYGGRSAEVLELLYVDWALRECGGNKTAAGEMTGNSRKFVERRSTRSAEAAAALMPPARVAPRALDEPLKRKRRA